MLQIAGSGTTGVRNSIPYRILLLTSIFLPVSGQQTATYHLHQEASTTTGLYQLKASGPDAAVTLLQSAQLRNSSPGEFVIKQFDTPVGVPNSSGVVPSGSAVTITMWMKKTASAGVLYPRAKLNLNSSAGAAFCSATGTVALTTVLSLYTLTCSAISNVNMSTADRLYLWTGVYLSTGPGNQSLYAELASKERLTATMIRPSWPQCPFPRPELTP